MSRDIVSLFGAFGWSWWDASGLEVAGGVEGELAEQFSGVAVDDPDLKILDEQGDAGAGVASSDSDVVQSAVVPQGDHAGGVDAVEADAVVAGGRSASAEMFAGGEVRLAASVAVGAAAS